MKASAHPARAPDGKRPKDSTGKVVIGIACHRANAAAFRLARRVIDEDWPADAVYVLDSEGPERSVERDRLLVDMGTRVQYFNYPLNLGSAGNLAERVRRAKALAAEWFLAMNHDSLMTKRAFRLLLNHARGHAFGALYPLHRVLRGGEAYDITGTKRCPLRAVLARSAPRRKLLDVYWSSSNDALYSVGAVSARFPFEWSELWMGWEDYALGHLLYGAGYRQGLVTEAVVDDARGYAAITFPKGQLTYLSRPIWYHYYSTRNRLAAARHAGPGRLCWVQAFLFTAAAIARAGVISRGSRVEAVRYALGGLMDYRRGRLGKWRLP